MKKAILIITIVILLAVSVITATAHNYIISAKIVEVNECNNIVLCEDNDGNLWGFYGVGNWQINDSVNLLMDNNNTANIYDDVVKNIF